MTRMLDLVAALGMLLLAAGAGADDGQGKKDKGTGRLAQTPEALFKRRYSLSKT